MKEWKGNEIQIGDIVLIYLYRYIPCNGFKFGFMDKHGDVHALGEDKIKSKEDYHWILCCTHEIIDGNIGMLKEDREPEDVIPMPLCAVDFMIDANDYCHAVCIKGKSDNREEFMLNHFKV